jgi:hypothetical protein
MSLEFLAVLESRVRDAAERIEELAAENAQLRKEIEKLERDRSAAKGDKADKSVEKLEKAWAKERDEIRRRVEPLVERLAKLLEEPPAA